MKYDSFQYIYPPRPASSIHPDNLNKFQGWIAQYKFNGTRNVIFVFPDGHIELFNRHREHNKAYQLTPQMVKAFSHLNLKKGKFYVFDGELMHNKTRGLKDRLILFDLLVNEGEYLIGTSYKDRYLMLQKLLGNPAEFESETGNKIAYLVNENIWFAKVYTKNLDERFQKLIHMDEVEGLVLKNPHGKLSYGVSPENNGDWIIRVRKPHKNYSY